MKTSGRHKANYVPKHTLSIDVLRYSLSKKELRDLLKKYVKAKKNKYLGKFD
jgi:hypothetical protein